MFRRIIEASIRRRVLVVGLLVLTLAGGVMAARALPIDAVPDVSPVQVAVLTDAPGMSPLDVERSITFPMETGLNGTPGLTTLRSVSRSGLSAVTAIFKDGTDLWFARALILERVRGVESVLPAGAGRPELSPVSGGLGEVYQFVVRSPHHSPTQLRTALDWDIVPKLRGVPGVVDVNTMGGDLKEYQVVVDRGRLHAHQLPLEEVAAALQSANANVGGGYVDRNAEALTLVGIGLLRNEEDIGNVLLRVGQDGAPLLVKHVAEVRVGAALRRGVITRDGEGEAVTGTVMMLMGANSRTVVRAVKSRIAAIQRDLPAGMEIVPVYDRSDFIGRTLRTVLTNLAEGALIVVAVLALMLGTLRGALVVVLGIPVSMAIALFGMHAFGVTGDLMSLGAIDFGFLVDGPIVILEGVVAATAGKTLLGDARRRDYADVAGALARPVAFSVAIILLVYLPLLTLEGVEGKMFRPMALTMACALFGALVFAVFFFPALLVLFVPPKSGVLRTSRRRQVLSDLTKHGIEWAARRPWRLLGGATVAFTLAILGFRGGADFVPRIEEGDAVVTIRRAPSISLAEARELDLATERVLKRFPEVVTTLGMTGRAEIAIDPVGNDNTDIFVHLTPRKQWTTTRTFDDLSVRMKDAIESSVAGTFVSVSQPIEDKTNELISGSRADVQIAISGSDLKELKDLSERVGALVSGVRGTGDVRVERTVGAPTLAVLPDRVRLARYGATTQNVLAAVQAARIGIRVGMILEENQRFELRLVVPPSEPSPDALGGLFVEAANRTIVPLKELARIEEVEGPTHVRRNDLARTVRVEVNLRGRDLVSWVREARDTVARELPMPTGYEVTWGGQFENFARAKARLSAVVPMSLAIIFGMLLVLFRSARYALAVFAVVPFAIIGGVLGLIVRDLSFSIPAAVGFIALAGVSVLNGVVLASEAKRLIAEGIDLSEAVVLAAMHTARAVLTTGAVAALGFLPMAIATGAGAEVQRPLATVVTCGIALSTLLTLFLLPSVLTVALRTSSRRAAV